MAHKTIVGGTQYNIKKGKALVGGTEYSVKKGKTLIGGTAYEVGFDDGMRRIACVECDTSYAEIQYTIGNSGYTIGDVGEYVIPVGTVLECWVMDDNGWSGGGFAGVVVNGAKVFETPSDGTYEYTVTKNATVRIVNNVERGVIYITEE